MPSQTSGIRNTVGELATARKRQNEDVP
jgi:hypothetical protein